MNAAGMIVRLSGVSSVLGMPFYQSLVTDGSINQGELDGTRHNLSAVIATLKKAPSEKIEALVEEYNEDLTVHMDKFDAIGQQDFIGGFRNAQALEGYVTMIMGKSGLK